MAAPVVGDPAVLQHAEHPLRVRHHDGDAPVGGGKAGNALRGAVRVGRVLLGGVATTVHVTQRHESLLEVTLQSLVRQLYPSFAVGHGNRYAGTGHVLEQNGGRILDLHQRGSCFKLLGQVAHKARPVLGTRDQVFQMRQHLAAITHPQRKGIFAEEETVEVLAEGFVVQHGLGPAATGTQYIAIGEPATGHQPLEIFQLHAASQQIAHVHINGVKTDTVEGRGHLGLTVNALLAQNRHLRARARVDHGRGQVLGHIEGQAHVQARVVAVRDGIKFLTGTIRVIAQGLNPVAGFRPDAVQFPARCLQQDASAQTQTNYVVAIGLPQTEHALTQTGLVEPLHHLIGMLGRHLNHRPQLFREQCGHRLRAIAGDVIQGNVQTGAAREGHLGKGGEQTAVRAVVVRQQFAFRQQLLGHLEEGNQVFGIVQIRGNIPHLTVHLRQSRARQTVLATAQIQ